MVVRVLALLLMRVFDKQFRQAMVPEMPVPRLQMMPTFVGWFTNKEKPRKEEVFRFHYMVTADRHVWAFKKGDPKLRIGALEMFGSLLLAKFLVKDDGAVTLPNLEIPWSPTTKSTECILDAEPEHPQIAHSPHADGDASSAPSGKSSAGSFAHEARPEHMGGFANTSKFFRL